MMATDAYARQDAPPVRHGAVQKLMEDAPPPPRQRGAHKKQARVGDAVCQHRHIEGIPRKIAEPCVRFKHQRVVGIQEQHVVAKQTRFVEGLVAVGGKIPPRPLDQGAREVAHQAAYEVLRAVTRSRVDDQPGIDEVTHAVQAACDHRRFVADDHAKADCHPPPAPSRPAFPALVCCSRASRSATRCSSVRIRWNNAPNASFSPAATASNIAPVWSPGKSANPAP